MAEPEKDQIGDGQDNFGQAAGKAIQAAKQISHDAAAEAAGIILHSTAPGQCGRGLIAA